MPQVTIGLRNVDGTEAAMGWAGSHTIVVNRPDGTAGGPASTAPGSWRWWTLR